MVRATAIAPQPVAALPGGGGARQRNTRRRTCPVMSAWVDHPRLPGRMTISRNTRWTLPLPRAWMGLNEPSLRVAQRAGYHFEQRLTRHCRDWSAEDASHDSWHDCLIWAYVEPQSH